MHRFDPHARAYAIGRPRYPRELAELVAGLGREVADVGAGTGIATELLLEHGLTVHAIEPAPAMRAEARVPIAEGSAEATGLPDASVDVVLAAQAAHWFDPEPTVREWRRILRPGGHAVLVWNTRRIDDAFGAELDAALERLGDRSSLGHTSAKRPRTVERLLGAHTYFAFDNPYPVDAATFAAYLASISYLGPHDPRIFEEMFERHATGGIATIPLRCDVYVGSRSLASGEPRNSSS